MLLIIFYGCPFTLFFSNIKLNFTERYRSLQLCQLVSYSELPLYTTVVSQIVVLWYLIYVTYFLYKSVCLRQILKCMMVLQNGFLLQLLAETLQKFECALSVKYIKVNCCFWTLLE